MGNSSSSNGDRPDTPRGSVASATSSSGGGGGGNQERRLSSRSLSHRIVGGGSNNNAHSRSSLPMHLPNVSLPSPFRSGGSLGLSRSELDARCQPSGLYPTCEWETKQIRRLISNGQLAARLKGSDSRNTKTDRECPICFMYYPETNVSKCCNATLCTECYLQIKPQKDKHTCCPFCNNPKMIVSVQGKMEEVDVAKREEEEQRVIEATIRSRVSDLHGETPPSTPGTAPGSNLTLTHNNAGNSEHTAASDGNSSFGSSLENYNRARTFSASSASNVSDTEPGSPATPIRPVPSDDSDPSTLVQSLAMSPADRRALESEMRAQLSHETHRRTEREAEEARMRHTQEWYGSAAGSRSRVREARLAELTGLLERMSARGGGGGGGLGSGGSNDEGDGPLMAGAGDAVGLRAGRGGASLSRLLRAMETSNTLSSAALHHGGRNANLEDLMRLEAAFFLGMDNDDNNNPRRSHQHRGGSRRSSGRTSSRRNTDSDDTDNGEAVGVSPFGGGRPPSSFGGSSSRRVVRGRGLAGSRRGVSTTHMDTAELLMRGVSEEEQLAMAIAMSMQEAQQNQQQQSQGGGGGGGGEGGGQQQVADGHETEEEDDDDNGSSSSESISSESSAEEMDGGANSDGGEETNDAIASNDNIVNDNDNGAVSLDEDEEEVIFTDSAEV